MASSRISALAVVNTASHLPAWATPTPFGPFPAYSTGQNLRASTPVTWPVVCRKSSMSFERHSLAVSEKVPKGEE